MTTYQTAKSPAAVWTRYLYKRHLSTRDKPEELSKDARDTVVGLPMAGMARQLGEKPTTCMTWRRLVWSDEDIFYFFAFLFLFIFLYSVAKRATLMVYQIHFLHSISVCIISASDQAALIMSSQALRPHDWADL